MLSSNRGDGLSVYFLSNTGKIINWYPPAGKSDIPISPAFVLRFIVILFIEMFTSLSHIFPIIRRNIGNFSDSYLCLFER